MPQAPEAFGEADGCFLDGPIHPISMEQSGHPEGKEKDSHNISQFRSTTLLNVEGKTSLLLVAKRMTTTLQTITLTHQYTSCQKVGVPGWASWLRKALGYDPGTNPDNQAQQISI